MAERRARGDEFAGRINRAVELLASGSRPAAVRRALEREYGLSTRQALRYVCAARAAPEGAVVLGADRDVDSSTACFGDRCRSRWRVPAWPGDRGADGGGAVKPPRSRRSSSGWRWGLRSAMSAIVSPTRGSRRPMASAFLNVAVSRPRQPRR